MPLHEVVPLTLMACGVAVALVGLPLWLGRVGPNRLFGISTPATRKSRALWDVVNRAAGRDTMLAGALIGAVGVIAHVVGDALPREVLAIGGVAVLVFAPLIALLVGHARASRLAREGDGR